MEFLLQDTVDDDAPKPLWKLGLMLLAIVLVGFVIYRMRG